MKTTRISYSAVIFLALAAAIPQCQGQEIADQELAAMLANSNTQQKGIAQVVVSKGSKIPILLSWTRNPPVGLSPLEQYQLNIGMAIAFGQVRTKEAIPFLIKNLTLNRFPATNVWTRPPELILERLPAVAALIQIGPDASRAIIRTPRNEMSAHDRLAAVFVVSRIRGVPEAREFVTSALGEANMLRERAEEGLKILESNQ